MLLIAHQLGHTAGASAVESRAGRLTRVTRIDWVDVLTQIPPLTLLLTELTPQP